MTGLLPRNSGSQNENLNNITTNDLTVNSVAVINSLIAPNITITNINATTATVSGLATVGSLDITSNPSSSSTRRQLTLETSGAVTINTGLVDLTSNQVLQNKKFGNPLDNTIDVVINPGGSSGTSTNLNFSQTANTNIAFPTTAGTLALTSQIPGITINNASGVAAAVYASAASSSTNAVFNGIIGDGTTTTVISAPGGGGNITLSCTPNIVQLSAAQTLTNKTIDSASNTLTITNSPLSNANINTLLNQSTLTTAAPTFAGLTLTGDINIGSNSIGNSSATQISFFDGGVKLYRTTLTTTNATVTTAITIPLATGHAYTIVTSAQAYDSSATAALSRYKIDAFFCNVNVSSTGSNMQNLSSSGTGLTTAAITHTASGSNVLVQVTGVAAMTLAWSVDTWVYS